MWKSLKWTRLLADFTTSQNSPPPMSKVFPGHKTKSPHVINRPLLTCSKAAVLERKWPWGIIALRCASFVLWRCMYLTSCQIQNRPSVRNFWPMTKWPVVFLIIGDQMIWSFGHRWPTDPVTKWPGYRNDLTPSLGDGQRSIEGMDYPM